MNSYHISTWIVGLGLWPLIIAIAPNLIFRRYGQAAVKKRMASLYHALAVFAITSTAAIIVQRELADYYLYIGILLVLGVLFLIRRKAFPYRFTCPGCAAKLDFRTIYFMDDNLCPNCRPAKTREEDEGNPKDGRESEGTGGGD